MNPLAALQADPFLPAVEWLHREGQWDDDAPDVPAMMHNQACHTRPMFELIPDHADGCECVYSSHDAARWRPLSAEAVR